MLQIHFRKSKKKQRRGKEAAYFIDDDIRLVGRVGGLWMGGLVGENDTLDGEEILRSPVEVGSENPIIYKVWMHYPRWLGMGFLNHQQ